MILKLKFNIYNPVYFPIWPFLKAQSVLNKVLQFNLCVCVCVLVGQIGYIKLVNAHVPVKFQRM